MKKRPATLDDLRNIINHQIHHEEDNGRIKFNTSLNSFTCNKCDVIWGTGWIGAASDKDLSERFYVKLETEKVLRLVEKEVGSVRYTTLEEVEVEVESSIDSKTFDWGFI